MPSLDLTTATLVKGQLDPAGSFSTTYDTLIGNLITAVSDRIERVCGREFLEEPRTEFYDGSGRRRLQLRQGPLVSVASVHSVEYIDAGAGARGVSLTEIFPKDRLEDGLRADGEVGRGAIVLPWAGFARGILNYKVIYTAGLATATAGLPEALTEIATVAVIQSFNNRDTWGLISKTVGDAEWNPVPLTNLDAWLVRSCGPWRLFGGA